jgi:hypothetical protein
MKKRQRAISKPILSFPSSTPYCMREFSLSVKYCHNLNVDLGSCDNLLNGGTNGVKYVS